MTLSALWSHRGNRMTLAEPITVPHAPDHGDWPKDGHMTKTNQSISALGLSLTETVREKLSRL